MPYKKAGSLSAEQRPYPQPKGRFEYHAVVALGLMVVAVLARFILPEIIEVDNTPKAAMSYLGFWLAAKAFWVWASIHLALHYRLSAAWGLYGLLFLIGTAIIVWAGIQKPNWDRAKARRPNRKNNYEGDPNSPY